MKPIFVIWGKDYLNQSGGRRALHQLCDRLILQGQEAYVFASVTNPKLFTPTMGLDLLAEKRQHRSIIGVYPEVIPGNPLNADVVVRWLLNKPGLLRKGWTPDAYSPRDLIFFWDRDYVPAELTVREGNELKLPHIDPVFLEYPAERPQRRGKLLFARKFRDLGGVVPAELRRSCRDISPQITGPIPPEALQKIFWSAEALISFELSATCTEAKMCQCPVEYQLNERMPAAPEEDSFGDVRRNYAMLREAANFAMEHFIISCLNAASA